MQTVETSQVAWKRAKVLTNALQMEKDYGCELSPYAKVLLNNLHKLILEQIDLNAGAKKI